ncbi:MAG: hypothetical protein P4L84_17075 [Isosphaeraceae bacterium]|nr:hypothetical protein [Isosphaeraceae bacterium]
MDSSERKPSTLAVALAWLVVTLPLGWGVYQSVVKSLPLFRASASTVK